MNRTGKYVDYVVIRGFEYRRSDTPTVLKDFQGKLFDTILSDMSHEEVQTKVELYVDEMVNTFIESEHNIDLLEKIAIPIGISKPIESYGLLNKAGHKSGVPPQIRGAIVANHFFGTNFNEGTKIKMIYVKNTKLPEAVLISGQLISETDVLCFDDVNQLANSVFEWSIDIKKMIQICVTRKIEFLSGIDIQVSVSTDGKQTKLF